jgi:endonuclease/exonuclease/phosphatase family metal-dependent hydrolase
MKSNARFRVVLLVLLVTAFFTSASPASTGVKVMTYNVDEGTDFAAIIALLNNPSATEADVQAAVAATIAEVESSHPEVRMPLIANEINSAQPDLVGLQEVAVWMLPTGNLDLLQLILNALPNYQAAVIQPEFQIDLTAQFGVAFTDQDVILVRSGAFDSITSNQGHYNALIPLSSPFLPAGTTLTRGWASVDAHLNGTAFRFITTHLEDGTNTISPIFALVQALQAIQLVKVPANTALPEIVAGDFNTVANNPFSLTYLTYSFMLANGFSDAWSRTHPFQIFSGATCCQENLRSSTLKLTQRLDQVFVRNHVSVVPFGTVLVDQFDAVDSFWPSDHAAVKSSLQVGSLP